MKIVCDGCSTKYSIADDKLAGKVFKIRCKKCGHVNLVRGAQPAPAEPAATADVAWHIAAGGQQVGPLDSAELLRRRSAGDLDDNAYVWREGFADWQTLGSVSELHAAPASPLHREDPLDIGDGRTARRDATPSRLHAERNESSVLFTLSSLSKLASPAPAKSVAAPTTASGEGSGLIDIRSLASSLAPQLAARRTPSITGSIEDLPVFQQASFIEHGVLIPTPRRAGRDRRLVAALVAVAGMLALVATILVVIVTREDATAQAATVESPPPATRVATAEPPVRRTTETPAISDVPAHAPTVAPVAPVAPIVPPPTRTVAPPPSRTAPPSRTTPSRTVRTTPSTTPTTNPLVPARTTPNNECREVTEVSCVVSGYEGKCCEIYRRTPVNGAQTPATGLPENLDRAAISIGLTTIQTKACSSSARGDVKLSIKISAAGFVTAVTVVSSPDPALASCVSAAARKGSFPKTQRGGSFAYVWRF